MTFNVDWATIYAKVNEDRINYANNSNTPQSILSLTIQPGKYYVKFGVGYDTPPTLGAGEFRPAITMNDEEITGTYSAYRSAGQHYLEVSAVVNITQITTFTGVVVNNQNGVWSGKGCVSLVATPVA